MGYIYRGTGWNKSIVGCCEDGVIYKCKGLSRTQIGTYDHNRIYRGTSGWSQTEIGKFEDGVIYSGSGWSFSQVGSYDNGTTYAGSSGWGRTAIGLYDGSPASAAALLLFLELNDDRPVEINTPGKTTNSADAAKHEQQDDPLSGFIALFPKVILILFGVVLLVLLVYHMYFTVNWKWANYAMFFTSIVSFFVTNVILYSSCKQKQNIADFRNSLFQDGLTAFLSIGIVIAFIIYIVEQIILKTLTFWMFLLGFIIAPVNFFIYAFPFLLAEMIILLISKAALNKKA